jgi:hypothetical protein
MDEVQTTNEESEEITVAEVQDLMAKVDTFYKERKHPPVNMFWLADTILKRLYNDLDYYVNVEGTKGFGKSNFILLLALIQCRYSGLWQNTKTGKIVKVLPRSSPLPPPWKHIKFGFQFSKNMSFMDDTKALKKKHDSLDRYMPFIIDEGSKNLHKYQWATKLQFMLVQMSDVDRYQNKSFYVCFPNFKELNPTFRNDRISMRIYIYNKHVSGHFAQAIFSLKDVNRWIPDPWHTDENAKQFDYLLRKVPIAQRTPFHILYAESKLLGYGGCFDIPEVKQLSPRIWNIYYKNKIENSKREDVESLIDEAENKNTKRWKDVAFSLLQAIKLKFPGIKYSDLSNLTGMAATTIGKWVNDYNSKPDNLTSVVSKAQEMVEKQENDTSN